jgi:hypothetical protein
MSDDPRAELARLEEEERAVSARRRRLHDRIDFLRATAGDAAQLADLIADEHQVSAARHTLHERIDALRVQLGLEPGPPKRQSLRD